MRANPAVDIKDFDPMFSGEHPTDLLVLRVFLITAARITIKGEERALWIMNGMVVFFKVFDDVCSTEITCNSHVNSDFNDLIDICGTF